MGVADTDAGSARGSPRREPPPAGVADEKSEEVASLRAEVPWMSDQLSRLTGLVEQVVRSTEESGSTKQSAADHVGVADSAG